MVEDYDSIPQNSDCDVVLRSEEKSIFRSCWIYKVKQASYGSVEKNKAKFLARGFS